MNRMFVLDCERRGKAVKQGNYYEKQSVGTPSDPR